MKGKKNNPFVVTEEDRKTVVGEEVLRLSEKVKIVKASNIAYEVFGITEEEVEEIIKRVKFEKKLH